MLNFTYWNPVKIIFGKNSISELTNLISPNKRVLMIFGSGSIKRNGVYEQVTKALAKHNLFEFGGIESNPLYETCLKAVRFVKEENIDFLLAVGGGSVLDATKFISLASKYESGDPWDILIKPAKVKESIPLGCVLTLPATGSEMNCGAVISNGKTKEKFPFFNPLVYPQFSIIDPQTNYSLPVQQTINGIVDTYVHVLEQYITYEVDSPLQDRQAEAILKTLLETAPKVLKNPTDYNTRANLCWCATQALNNIISCGVPQDWATHMIGHELTAIYGIAHAQSLAIVLPRLWKNRKEDKADKLFRYANRVLGISSKDKEETIDKAIQETESFFRTIGMKTKLSDYNINAFEAAEKISGRFKERKTVLGEKGNITPEIVKSILLDC